MKNSEVIVLVACMHQTDCSIIERLNIQTDAVIINQCDRNEIELISYVNKKGVLKEVKFISTTERGLSRSRNMAIRNVNTPNSICLLCDEDEVLFDDYETKILEGYKYHKNPDVVAFSVRWSGFGKKYPTTPQKINYIKALRICSVQITFRYSLILSNNISFDEKMGSGTGNGAGEDIKFMVDCYRKRLSIAYYPNCIASINDGGSQWFRGFNKEYFINFGWATKRIHRNTLLTIMHIFYYAISKKGLYQTDIDMIHALKYMLRGSFAK